MSIKELASKYKNLMETKKKVKKAYKVAVEMMINKVVLKLSCQMTYILP